VKVFKKDLTTGTVVPLEDLEKGELKNTQIALHQLLGIDAATFMRLAVL
jgi:hypothetical protein